MKRGVLAMKRRGDPVVDCNCAGHDAGIMAKTKREMEHARKALPILVLAASGQMCIAQGIFTATGPMTVPRAGHTATLLADGRVLIAGGSTPESAGSAELYDPTTGTFSRTGSMTTNRVNHTATLLADGKVLIAGGEAPSAPYSELASAELYDPATGTFTATGAMLKARFGHVAALLPNGKVLVAGGGDITVASAEIYDPVSGTFSPTADMHPSCYGKNTAILLASGKVFIGGCATSDLYDSATGAFDTTGGWEINFCCPVDIWPDAQTLLTNGQVLVTGGDPNDYVGSSTFAGVYDPGAGRFRATGPMSAARYLHTATTLPDGTALITGGGTNFGPTVGAAELYDPAIGGFASAGFTITARASYTATLLNSGQVLIAGGFTDTQFPFNNGISLASAELYNPTVMIPAPMLFSLSSDGKGQGAIWDGVTGRVVSPSAPGVAGEILSMYTSGLENGNIIPPQVAVGGRLAEIQYFGDAPGYAGYSQVNFRLPNGITSGSAVPVRLIYLGRSSNVVTIAVK